LGMVAGIRFINYRMTEHEACLCTPSIVSLSTWMR